MSKSKQWNKLTSSFGIHVFVADLCASSLFVFIALMELLATRMLNKYARPLAECIYVFIHEAWPCFVLYLKRYVWMKREKKKSNLRHYIGAHRSSFRTEPCQAYSMRLLFSMVGIRKNGTIYFTGFHCH